MTHGAGERRIYNDSEERLIRRGRAADAKVKWTERYDRSTPEQRLAMCRSTAR